MYIAHKISFLAFKLNLFSYDWGCDYVLGSTMFFNFSLFAATIFRGRLCLGRDYILNNYGNQIQTNFRSIKLPKYF